MLCGHRTLEFVLCYYWGTTNPLVKPLVERITQNIVTDLVDNSKLCAGIVFTSQLSKAINQAQTEFAPNKLLPFNGNGLILETYKSRESIVVKRNLPVRSATIASGWRTKSSGTHSSGTIQLAQYTTKATDGRISLARSSVLELVRLTDLERKQHVTGTNNQMPTSKLVNILQDRGSLAIMLIDARYLPYWSDQDRQLRNNVYRGHYITLVNFDPVQKMFQIYDPTYSAQFHQLSVPQLQQIRRLSSMVCSNSIILIKTKSPPKNKRKNYTANPEIFKPNKRLKTS